MPELLEVRNANLRLLLSARDERGELRTCAATLFDGAAYFHQPLGSAVKGGPSWVFPGPFFYELSVQAGAAPLGALVCCNGVGGRGQHGQAIDLAIAALPPINEPGEPDHGRVRVEAVH